MSLMGLKIKMAAGLYSFWRLWGKRTAWASRGCLQSLACGSLHLQGQQSCCLRFYPPVPFSDSDPPACLFHLFSLCDYIAPSQIIHENHSLYLNILNLITSAHLLLPHKLTTPHLPGMRTKTSLGSIYLLSTDLKNERWKKTTAI